MNEGDLEVRSGEQPGHERPIESSSVRARPKTQSSADPQGPGMASTTKRTSSLPGDTHQAKRFFDLDLLVLVIIGSITLLAAVYTLLPTLLGAESTQPQATTAEAAIENAQPETTTRTAAVPENTVAPTVAPAAGWVSALGDSVMLGAVDALRQDIPNLGLLNAQGSRQPPAAIDILRQLRDAGHLGNAVVVHVGNNGPFTEEEFDEMMQTLQGVRKVLIVNLTVPSGVPDPVAVPNNAVLAEGARRYPNAVLVNWHDRSAEHPEYFGEDGTHLTLEGAQAYAKLIAFYLDDSVGSSAPPTPQETTSWGEGGSFGECVGPPSWCIGP